MKRQPGMVAPDFQRADIFGSPIQLYDKEGGMTLLSFFRNAASVMHSSICRQAGRTLPDHR